MAFDELDGRIVAVLVGNARATYAEVGAKVGLSAPAVKRRVDRLLASGAITGFAARVDPSAMAGQPRPTSSCSAAAAPLRAELPPRSANTRR